MTLSVSCIPSQRVVRARIWYLSIHATDPRQNYWSKSEFNVRGWLTLQCSVVHLKQLLVTNVSVVAHPRQRIYYTVVESLRRSNSYFSISITSVERNTDNLKQNNPSSAQWPKQICLCHMGYFPRLLYCLYHFRHIATFWWKFRNLTSPITDVNPIDQNLLQLYVWCLKIVL